MWVSEDGVRWTDTGTPWQPYPTDYPVCAFRNEMTNGESFCGLTIFSFMLLCTVCFGRFIFASGNLSRQY